MENDTAYINFSYYTVDRTDDKLLKNQVQEEKKGLVISVNRQTKTQK